MFDCLRNCNYVFIVITELNFRNTGVGTRDYYRKMGYQLEGPYMVKWLKSEVSNNFDGSLWSCKPTGPLNEHTKSNSQLCFPVKNIVIKNCIEEVKRNTVFQKRASNC